MDRRILQGGKNIILNSVVGHIPSWTIRKFFYRLFGMKIGKHARIGIRTKISKPELISIGDRTVINQDCFLDGRGGLIIEKDVSISSYSKIITESHKKNSGDFETYRKQVIIHSRVWLGMNAMVLMGSEIGENAIIGAGCVFKGECKKNAIMVGNPAKCVGTRQLERLYEKTYRAYFI